MWSDISVDDWVKIILAIIGLITALIGIFSYSKRRSHKLRNITGSNNNIVNGDIVYKRKNDE